MSTEAVLLISIVDALEERDVSIMDIPNAFIQTRVLEAKQRVIIRLMGIVVDWLVKAAPDVYTSYVTVNK